MELSFVKKLKNEIDISIPIENADLTIRLNAGFFSPVGKVSAGLHNHSTYEIHIVIEGSHEVFIHNRFYTVNAGDICFLSPGVYHYNSELPEKPSKICTFKLIIPAEKTRNNKKPVNSPETEVVLATLTNKKFAVFRDSFISMNLIPEVLRELDEKPLGFYTSVQALFMRIIINLARSISQTQLPDYTINIRIPEEIRNELIEGFFYHNFHQSITAFDLTELVNISRRQLHRILKELYNLSFKQKLLETRVEKAKDLLQNSNMSIESVAEKVGYLNPANFYSIFKKTTGMSPGSYRKTSGNNALDSVTV